MGYWTTAFRPFQVLPALAHEQLAVRTLLGHAGDPLLRPRLYAAVLTDDAGVAPVVGALAVQSGPLTPVRGLRVELAIAPSQAGRGLAEALVTQAETQARSSGFGALYALLPVAPDGPEAATWRDLGFDREVSVQHYETDPIAMREVLEPLCETLQQRGRIPPEARVIPLAEAPQAPIVDLHVRYLGGHRPAIWARMAGLTPDAYDQDHSWVLMLGERVAGFLLARFAEPDVPVIEAAVVIPELRLGWANALLKLYAARQGVKNRRRAIRFYTLDQHQDTRRMAGMAGARLYKRQIIPYRLVEGGLPAPITTPTDDDDI